jgi:ketosteroid isomerase-like protein
MKCPILVLLLLLQPFVHAQSSKPAPPQSDELKIRSLEERWLHAIEISDLAALDSILADDFVRPAPSAGRFISKAQLLDYFKSHKTPPRSRHIENLNVTVYGNTAIARGSVVIADPKSHVTSMNLFTDVFVLRNGRWLAVSAQENEVTTH